MEGWMSTPDPDHETPSRWNNDDKKLANDISEKVKNMLETLTRSDPIVVTRPMQPALDHKVPYGTMWIDETNAVTMDGDTQCPHQQAQQAVHRHNLSRA